MPEYDRHFEFEQVFNLRDMGGYLTADGRQVRWRRLIRSSEHHRMTEAEATAFVSEVPLATVIDFRADGETEHRLEPGPLVSDGVTRIHLGMGDPKEKYRAREEGEWTPGFASTLDSGAVQWTATIHALAEEDAYPALFHCVTGKDRTGVMGALILNLLGVDDETIIEDYGLSQRGMDTMFESLQARGIVGADEERNPAMGVVPAAMREMLDVLREKYGTARNFFEAQGVAAGTLDRVVDLLLEPAGE